nr:unnamed protein product [Callosobruchus analis]
MKKKERRLAIIALRRKGNFILNKELNKLKPVRKPNNSENTEGVYYPCTNCLGFFKKSYLWRHKKKCNTLTGIKKSQCRTNHLSEAQTFIAATGLLGNYLEKSRLKAEVFSIMKGDKISFAAKCDPLICLYGESYLGSASRWMSGSYVVRKFAYKCGASRPELLTSTRFRKQIATILQLMSFQNDEMEQIARLTEDTYQTAKVAKVLLLLNAGKGSEFKGKCLNEIEVGNDVLELEIDETDGTGNEIQVKDAESREDKSSSRTSISVDYPHLESNSNEPPKPDITNKKIKPQKRICWSSEEKQLMLKYFQKNIIKCVAPRKQDCLDFINKNESIFKKEDWIRVKTFVYNTYRLQ